MNGFMDIRMQPSYQEFYRMKQVSVSSINLVKNELNVK